MVNNNSHALNLPSHASKRILSAHFHKTAKLHQTITNITHHPSLSRKITPKCFLRIPPAHARHSDASSCTKIDQEDGTNRESLIYSIGCVASRSPAINQAIQKVGWFPQCVVRDSKPIYSPFGLLYEANATP